MHGAIRDADRIVVIDDGRVREHGTHDELLQRGDGYARLWDAAGPRASAEPEILAAGPPGRRAAAGAVRVSQPVMSGPEPPLAHGVPMATGLTVLEHLSRNQLMDVYDVWDERRHCRCVAKVLHPDLSDSAHDQERLRREGELRRGFTHPHIVRAYETLGTPSLIVLLETLSGETLSHLIAHRARRMATSELAILGLQIGSATRYLHAEGWLHLDLKPSNVIIDGALAKVST